MSSARAIMLLAAVLLAACESKNLGPFFEKEIEYVPPPPPPPECVVSTASIACGQGICERIVPACLDGMNNRCEPGDPAAEVCNDLDDDCDGVIDNGCDDDGDGYCDASLAILGTPAICSAGGALLLDCDDDNIDRHPDQTELCDDAIDNDCDLLADYLDFAGCTHITASFQDSDGLITLEHGTSTVIRAVLTPPTLELTRKWSVTSAFPDTACLTTDVSLTEPNETASNTERRVRIADDPTKLDCEYRIVLTVGGIMADSIRLKMRNTRPRVDEVVGAVLDDATLVIQAASGRDPQLTAVVPMDADQPVVVSWGGRDIALLDCTAPCEGATMRFKVAPAPGSYVFVLSAKDSFDGVARTRNLRVEVVSCVWARATATGMGTGPAVADAYGTIAAAVAAADTQNKDVCIAGTARMNISSALTMPVGVSITGGFSTGGVPAATKSMLRLTNGARLSFAPGYRDAIRRVVIDADRASSMIEAVNASPLFYGAELVLFTGSGSRGFRLETTGPDAATARFASTLLRTSGAQADATGIEVVGSGEGLATLIWNGASTVDLTECTGLCRGISISGNASATLTADRVDVEAIGAGSRAYAIEVEGATADIRAIALITARTSAMDPADATIAVRLDHSLRVRIASNTVIGPTTQDAGRRFSAGIADGEIKRDGSIVRGDSAGLSITSNRQINAGKASWAWNGVTCADEMAAREGTDVSAGIVLVGSSTVTIENNGDGASRDYAIFGGATAATWDPAARMLPPSVPGVWTVDTIDVRLVKNEIRAGVLSAIEECAPSVHPQVVAVRDGLGPMIEPALPSRNLRLEKNGIGTGRRASFDNVPGIDLAGARLVELWGDREGAPAASVFLVNNYLAATRGVELTGLYAHRARHVELWNNVVEVESLSAAAMTRVKLGIVLDAMPPASVRLVNNIVLLREDEEDLSDPIALYLRDSDRALSTMNNNLWFVEAEERGDSGAYVELEGGARYSRATFSAFETAVGGANNLLLPPLFQSHALEHRRSITRLSSRSPAKDRGQLEGAPAEDRFANMRPMGAGVDIGHHELAP